MIVLQRLARLLSEFQLFVSTQLRVKQYVCVIPLCQLCILHRAGDQIVTRERVLRGRMLILTTRSLIIRKPETRSSVQLTQLFNFCNTYYKRTPI